MKHFVALCLLALSAITACAQIPPPPNTWGEAVEGVQLRIALPKKLPVGWFPPTADKLLKLMPLFELQIRNRGTASITIDPIERLCPDTEIDDVWYGGMCVNTGGGSGGPMDIAPDSMSRVFFLRPAPAVARNTQSVDKIDFFELHPGSYRIRLQISALVQLPKSRNGIDTTDGKALTLISNRISIDIPASIIAQIEQ